MADVRSLLKNERAARRIQHKHASYSSSGALLCSACHLQLKSESLWNGHLRSPGHIMRVQKLEEQKKVEPVPTDSTIVETNNKKRRASDEEDSTRKRAKPMNSLPDGFFDTSQAPIESRPILPSPRTEIQIPSRPATPSKPIQDVPKRVEVNEDEWAAFEADIAAAEVPSMNGDAVISAPAMTAAELAQKATEEINAQRKERQEAELEGEKEDAARKMEEQLEQMEGLEQRVKRLRQKREELRKKESLIGLRDPQASEVPQAILEQTEEDSDEDDENDDWDAFMMR